MLQYVHASTLSSLYFFTIFDSFPLFLNAFRISLGERCCSIIFLLMNPNIWLCKYFLFALLALLISFYIKILLA